MSPTNKAIDTNDSSSESRRDSLNARKLKDQPDIPDYLKPVSEAKESFSSHKTTENPAPYKKADKLKTGKGEIVIIMERSSIFAVFMGAALLSITSFVAGFITYQTYFTGTTEVTATEEGAETIQITKIPSRTATPTEDGQSLSEDALSFTDIFTEPETQELIATAGGGQIVDDISTAAEQTEGVKEALGEDIPEELTAAEGAPKTGEKETTEVIAQTVKTEAGTNSVKAEGTTTTPKTTVGEKTAANAEAKVDQESVETKTAAKKEVSTEEVPTKGYYTINLGEASSEQQAKSMKEELDKLGIQTFVVSAKTADGRETYNLRQGKFATYDDARRLLLNLPKPYSVWGKVEKDQSDKETKKVS